MTSEYKRVLRKWAEGKVPEGCKFSSVDVYEDAGYRYSEYTYEDPSVKVYIYYTKPNGEDFCSLTYDLSEVKLGNLLTELLTIAEQEDDPE